MTKIRGVICILSDLADHLNSERIHSFTVLPHGKTQTIYNINGWYITVKRDSKNIAYAVEIRLKVEKPLSEITY
ncbi:MAG: hypothetical protein NC177_07690 [Ruminococcus flavefaciens]|nr:hypothetical protein [Ruminococcus flavefaciens]